MNYSNIKRIDTANGPGVRVSLFVSGCRLHCKGCFSEQTWSFSHGEKFTEEVEKEIIEYLKPDYISGLSLLGGNPTEPENEEVLERLVKDVKEKFPNKDIWVWSGYVFEKLIEDKSKLLPYVDVIVDGPYVEKKRDITLKFRGSYNQRIIDVKRSVENGEVVECL